MVPVMVQPDSQPIPPEPPALIGFNHTDNIRFWRGIHPVSDQEPTDHDSKSFSDIKSAFERDFPQAPKLNKNLKMLKRCLGVNMNDEDVPVKVRKFMQATLWFGPLTRTGVSCTFLEQMNKVSSYTLMQANAKVSPFAGMITQEEAEVLLKSAREESYLVRFSESQADKGGFSLAVKANAADIRHYNILGDPQTAAETRPYNARLKLVHRTYPNLNDEEHEYRDIVDFMKNRLDDEIEDNIYCTYVCPDLPFNALFRGYD